MLERDSLKSLLGWYVEAGVDETIGNEAIDRRVTPPAFHLMAASVANQVSDGPAEPGAQRRALPPSTVERRDSAPRILNETPQALPEGLADVLPSAIHAAENAATLDELRKALEAFDGCPLSRTATNLVFSDGNPEARIVFIGEAPGADEDRQGIPFVGQSGQLLDRMLASIGLDRTGVLISNTVFWRPPGNRTPTTVEAAVCRPFVERLVEIVAPRIVVALGGAAAKSLLGRAESVGRLRGQWLPFSTPRLSRPVEATVTFHPAYLLRTPAAKRDAWRDLLNIKKKLASD